METKDRSRFATCLIGCAEIYGKEVSAGVASIWWDALKDYDFAAVDDAFRRHVQSPDVGQFMPKPADIIRMLQGTSLDGAMIAWSKADKAVRQVGTYATVTFDDPIINRVIQDMGGWICLGQKSEDEWPFVANEFKNRYKGFAAQGVIPDFPPKLAGRVDQHNCANGYPEGDPVLIGDQRKALAVLKGGTIRTLIATPLSQVGTFMLPDKVREPA